MGKVLGLFLAPEHTAEISPMGGREGKPEVWFSENSCCVMLAELCLFLTFVTDTVSLFPDPRPASVRICMNQCSSQTFLSILATDKMHDKIFYQDYYALTCFYELVLWEHLLAEFSVPYVVTRTDSAVEPGYEKAAEPLLMVISCVPVCVYVCVCVCVCVCLGF